MGPGYTSGMARVRTPYWLPGSARNWLLCNLFCVGMVEWGFYLHDFRWPLPFATTGILGLSLLVWSALHFLGRTALVEFEDSVRWRPAHLPEPGEPPPGNRLAWPAPGDAAPRVATPSARALTVRKRHSPRDHGEGPTVLVMGPLLGLMGAILTSVASAAIGLVYENSGTFYAWAAWAALVWVCITTSIVLKTRRLNEDA